MTGSEEWALLKAGEVWLAVVMPFCPLPWGVLSLVVGGPPPDPWRASCRDRRGTVTAPFAAQQQPIGAVSV